MRYLFGLILLLALAAGVAYVVAGRGGGPSIQIAKPEKFVGRAPEQVDEFLQDVVAPIRTRYAESLKHHHEAVVKV